MVSTLKILATVFPQCIVQIHHHHSGRSCSYKSKGLKPKDLVSWDFEFPVRFRRDEIRYGFGYSF